MLAISCAGTAVCAHKGKRLAGATVSAPTESFTGMASVYSKDYSGTTASGERYDPRQFTAAHRSLPFGTLLTVTDTRTGRSVTVVINDRGPFVKHRVLDLSRAAAEALGVGNRGIAEVSATVQYPRSFRLRDLFSKNER